MNSAKSGKEVLSKLADAKIIGDFHKYSQRNLHKEQLKSKQSSAADSTHSHSKQPGEYFDDDPLTLLQLHNPQVLQGNTIKAHSLDMIKSKINKKKLERSRILNELMNQKQEVEAIIQLSSQREKAKKSSEDAMQKLREKNGGVIGVSQKMKNKLRNQVDLTDMKIPVETFEDEKNNVRRFKHLQKVIDEAIHGQKCSDKAVVRGFHSLMIKKRNDGNESPAREGKVLEGITDRFEKIT